MLPRLNPFEFFTETDGSPLDGGRVYIGTVNQNPKTSPITVYLDSAMNIPASQPLQTVGGRIVKNGAAAAIYSNAASFSLLVENSRGQQVSYSATVESDPASLRDELALSSGSSGIGFIQSGAGAASTTVQAKLREFVSAIDFGAVGDGVTDDATAINEAITAIYNKGGGAVFFPVGRYLLSTYVLLKPGVSIVGEQKGALGSPSTYGVVFLRNFTSAQATFYSPSSQTIQGCHFENFIVEGAKGGIGGSNTSGHGIEIQLGNDNIFRRVWVSRCPGDGFRIGQGAASFHNYFYNCYAFFNGVAGYSNRSDWSRYIDCWSDGNNVGIDFPSGAQCGSSAYIERCHFEEWEDYGIRISGVSSFGGTGNNQIVGCKFFSRRYSVGMLGHGIFLDGATSANGASGNTIRDNNIIYQNSYGVDNSGTVGVIVGAGSDSNFIEDNRISYMVTGIRTDAGSARTSILDNSVYGNTLGVSLAGTSEIVRGHVSQANTTPASISSVTSKFSQSTFEAAVTLPTGSYVSDCVNAGGGTYTPELSFAGNSVGMTYGTQSGRWQQNGKVVTCWVQLVLTAKGSSTGFAAISLPVAPSGNQALGLVNIYTGGASITAQTFGSVKVGSAKFELAQGFPGTALTEANFTNTTGLTCSFSYEAS